MYLNDFCTSAKFYSLSLKLRSNFSVQFFLTNMLYLRSMVVNETDIWLVCRVVCFLVLCLVPMRKTELEQNKNCIAKKVERNSCNFALKLFPINTIKPNFLLVRSFDASGKIKNSVKNAKRTGKIIYLRSMVMKVIKLLIRNKALWPKSVITNVPVKRTVS